VFRLINLETRPSLYLYRHLEFRIINLETLTVLAYFFRDSKSFALLIKASISPGLFLRDSKSFALLI